MKVDTMIVQAIGLLDDLDKELNTYAMRVREWYGWHFPEMTRIVADNVQYARAVSSYLIPSFLPRLLCLFSFASVEHRCQTCVLEVKVYQRQDRSKGSQSSLRPEDGLAMQG